MHQEINKLTNSLKNPPSFSQCLLGIFHETVMGLDVEVTEVMKQGRLEVPLEHGIAWLVYTTISDSIH
jgi:hypothetical protein